ncbi:MAG: TonB-dependent receptor [Opitutus sp.]|nr:TonB-dependent receptor [Opitutus sp.]
MSHAMKTANCLGTRMTTPRADPAGIQPTARDGFTRLVALTLGLLALAPAASRAADSSETGRVVGNITNVDTRLHLDGAFVELRELGWQVLSDKSGQFVFNNVPPGNYTLVSSYTGVKPDTRSVRINPRQTVTVEVELRSPIYQLEGLVVVGEREGNAASITRQRNAPNVTTVQALDALGSMPNENLGELLIRMPGIAGGLNEEGVMATVGIRGTSPALNNLMIDGEVQPGSSSTDRTPRTFTISGAMFEEIEVIKAPTPEMRADALGGAINVKTRSTLSMSEKRRFTYKLGARWAPTFYEQIPARDERALHPQTGFGYQEVFSVFGGRKNLGISLDGVYSENLAAYFRNINYHRTNVLDDQVGVYMSHMADVITGPKQMSATLKVEYRVSKNTDLYATALYSDGMLPFYRLWSATAVGAQTVATLGPNGQPTGTTGSMLPGYTNLRTQIRALPASIMRLETDLISTNPRDRKFSLGAKHAFDALKLDYATNYSSSHNSVGTSKRFGNAGGGVLQYSVPNVGWIFDRTADAIRPTLTQTEGPSWFDIRNYGSALLVARDSVREVNIFSANTNASYVLPAKFPATIKAGLLFSREERITSTSDKRWNYTGPSLAKFVEPVTPSFSLLAAQRFPFVSASLAAQDVRDNPAQWIEDVYTDETLKFRSTNSLWETLGATYLQGQARFGALNLLGGVRAERARDSSKGFVQARVLSTTAQRTANAVAAAQADWNHPKKISGDYTNLFPSAHAVYRFTSRLQGRLSWSNTIGRPPPGSLLPVETPNNNTLILTVNNPSLKPQYSENWDAALEYYFEPVGQFSVGFFHKSIKDYISSGNAGVVGAGADNGYGGEYAGYSITSQTNTGSAKIKGWEFSYQQELTFLPGVLRGLGVFANFTVLDTKGDYGTGSAVSTTEVLGFIPHSGNVGSVIAGVVLPAGSMPTTPAVTSPRPPPHRPPASISSAARS